MKERIGFKETIFILKSLVSPFGTLKLRPLKGVSVLVENISDDKSPVEGVSAIDESGRVVVPEGGSAKVYLSHDGDEALLRIDDYREREGHTPGARITGDEIDITFGSKSRKKFIPGVGYVEYKK
ncbi:hypothetical protein IID22_05535 [Patescibacteria group bacterium]|nr:hypothetical protein [Patescibacteria group bacterium]